MRTTTGGWLGQWDDAASRFAQALRIDPYRPETHTVRGIVLGEQGRWDESVEHFDAALRLTPDDALALRNLEAARARRKGLITSDLPACDSGGAGCSR